MGGMGLMGLMGIEKGGGGGEVYDLWLGMMDG